MTTTNPTSSSPEKEIKDTEPYKTMMEQVEEQKDTEPIEEIVARFSVLERELWGTTKKAAQDVDEEIESFIRTQFPLYAAKEVEAARKEGYSTAKKLKDEDHEVLKEKAKKEGYERGKEEVFRSKELKQVVDEAREEGYEKGLNEVRDTFLAAKKEWERIAKIEGAQEERERIVKEIKMLAITYAESVGFKETINEILTLIQSPKGQFFYEDE